MNPVGREPLALLAVSAAEIVVAVLVAVLYPDFGSKVGSDFYATAAQAIPVLLLAAAVRIREFGSMVGALPQSVIAKQAELAEAAKLIKERQEEVERGQRPPIDQSLRDELDESMPEIERLLDPDILDPILRPVRLAVVSLALITVGVAAVGEGAALLALAMSCSSVLLLAATTFSIGNLFALFAYREYRQVRHVTGY